MAESLGIALVTIQQMLVLFIVACVGYVCAKRDIIDANVRTKVTRLLLDLCIPCMLISSVSESQGGGDPATVAMAFGLAFFQGASIYATGWLSDAILRVPREDWPVYPFMSLCNNTGFVGIPVCAAIFGDDCVVYVGVYVMVMSLITFSLGFFTIAPHTPGKRFSVPWKMILSPCMVGALIALALFLSPIRLSGFVQESLTSIGSITSPLAMMVVGAIVSEMPFREIFGEWRLYGYSLIRLLIVPAILYVVLLPLLGDPLQVGIFCTLFAMPTGPMCPTFCLQFGANDRLAARGVVLTAILSFVLIPALVIFMTMVA